jgi:hypothetical protein
LTQSVFSFFSKTNSIKFFHIGAAPLSQSPFQAIAFPLVFPTQTTVVISGVYHAVHKSQGRICFLLFTLNSLFEVHVFAHAVLSFRVKFLFQNSEGLE